MPNIYDVAKRARVSVATVSAVLNDSAFVSAGLKSRVHAGRRRARLPAQPAGAQHGQAAHADARDDRARHRQPVLSGSRARRRGHRARRRLHAAHRQQRQRPRGRKRSTCACSWPSGSTASSSPRRRAGCRRSCSARSPRPACRSCCSRAPSPASPPTSSSSTTRAPPTKASPICCASATGASASSAACAARARAAGVSTATRRRCKDWKIRLDPALVAEGDFRVESGYRAGLDLLKARPDAVFIANYLMTVGFMEALRQYRLRCPEDVALVTCDDYPWMDSFSPRLTTIDLPKRELGAAAAQLLVERIAEEGRPPADGQAEERDAGAGIVRLRASRQPTAHGADDLRRPRHRPQQHRSLRARDRLRRSPTSAASTPTSAAARPTSASARGGSGCARRC